MENHVESVFSGFFTVIQALVLIFVIMISLMTGLRYYQRYTEKKNIENFLADMLDYASKHDGFNSPTENTQLTFQDILTRYKEQYNINETTIKDNKIEFYPAPDNINLHKERSSEVSITITPMYHSVNPFDSNRYPGQTKVAKGVIHGYVKDYGEKDYSYESPIITIPKG